jgi:hypothetical protein
LRIIANAADKNSVMCIYDNHQWECSSWLGWGIGMPNSLVVVLKDRKSTLGFEILNEPEVFRLTDYYKVGVYHDFMVKEIRKITDKPLLFCWALSHGVIDNPILQALVAPATKDNVIYDGHAYPPSIDRMAYFRSISLLMGNVPLYIGEFNSGFIDGTSLTQDQVSGHIQNLKDFATYGWALWRWSYIPYKNISAFNMTQIVNSRIRPGPNFNYLKESIKKLHPCTVFSHQWLLQN